jgi:hypothetical protein
VTKADESLCGALSMRAAFADYDGEVGLARDLREAAERIRTLGSATLLDISHLSDEERQRVIDLCDHSAMMAEYRNQR